MTKLSKLIFYRGNNLYQGDVVFLTVFRITQILLVGLSPKKTSEDRSWPNLNPVKNLELHLDTKKYQRSIFSDLHMITCLGGGLSSPSALVLHLLSVILDNKQNGFTLTQRMPKMK